jgi:cytochrome c-type biogenesis protein CcmE
VAVVHDDEESSDAREVAGPTTLRARRRVGLGSRRRQFIALGVIAIALGVLLWKGLGNATVYFKTADEAVAQRAHIGTHLIRVEGTVQPDLRASGQDVAFTIANNGVAIPVVHHSAPPQLFKVGIPVVLEGRFQGDHFASDRIMVKHTADYIAKHPERVSTTTPTSK